MQRREVIQAGAALGLGGWGAAAQAHHGWSSFDQDRPLYLEGRAAHVRWRNPHVELALEVPETLRLPADLAQRSLPAQTASIDGPALLARTVLPTRRDRRWEGRGCLPGPIRVCAVPEALRLPDPVPPWGSPAR